MGCYSFEIQHMCTQVKTDLMKLPRPAVLEGQSLVVDLSNCLKFVAGNPEDELPFRAEPESDIDSATNDMENLLLAKLVEAAVRQVGWVPRDVYYRFMAHPTNPGMFFTSKAL